MSYNRNTNGDKSASKKQHMIMIKVKIILKGERGMEMISIILGWII